MHEGLYVARRAGKRRSNKFIMIESRLFQARSESENDQWRMRRDATSWAEFVQTEHPSDEVFVIEVKSIQQMQKYIDD